MSNATRQKANQARRELAARRQQPLPVEEQRRRAAERAKAKAELYPTPPRYATKVGNPDLREIGQLGPVLRPLHEVTKADPPRLNLPARVIAGALAVLRGK